MMRKISHECHLHEVLNIVNSLKSIVKTLFGVGEVFDN